MNPKVSVYIATSLDGYIARSNGDIDWLDAFDSVVPDGEDLGYQEFMDSVDVLVMGRRTYEKVRSFGAWPYAETPVIVLSSNSLELPEELSTTVLHSSEPPSELCRRLAREGVEHIYLDGGNTIQRFLAASLVDELTITVIPLLLGEGIPLFGPLAADVTLDCLSAEAYDFGFVQLKYTVAK